MIATSDELLTSGKCELDIQESAQVLQYWSTNQINVFQFLINSYHINLIQITKFNTICNSII